MKSLNQAIRWLAISSGVLLLVTSAAKLYSATGTARILTATDPLLHLRYRSAMIALRLLELAIALYLLYGRNSKVKPWLILWLSSNFMAYRFGSDLLHIKMCPCFGTLTSALPLSKGKVDFLLMLSVLYLFFGSAGLLLLEWSRRIATAKALQGRESLQRHEVDGRGLGSQVNLCPKP